MGLTVNCPVCHRSDKIDSLSNRCLRCSPVKIEELEGEFQTFANLSRRLRIYNLIFPPLVVFAVIVVFLYYALSKSSNISVLIVWVVLLSAVGLELISLLSFFFSRNYLTDYFRLQFVRNSVAPVDVLVRPSSGNSGRSTAYLIKVFEVRGGSGRPGNLLERYFFPSIRGQSGSKFPTVTKLNAKSHPPVWGKVYLDPQVSGNAVFEINGEVYVATRQSGRFFS